MSTFPLTDSGWRKANVKAAIYLRALADEFSNLSTIKVADAASEDWAAVEAALEAVSDALDWIAGPR